MSVSPLGGVIYTNQASPLVTQIHQPTQHRPDMIQFMLNQTVTEKEQEVEKVSEPVNEHGIDPDKDSHDNSQMYHKAKKNKQDTEEENGEELENNSATSELHHLDIKV